MIRAANLTQVTDYYKSNTVSKQNNTEKAKDVQPNAQKIKSSEDKLSSKAQKYLETLRKDNADFDFIIADKGDDFRGLQLFFQVLNLKEWHPMRNMHGKNCLR